MTNAHMQAKTPCQKYSVHGIEGNMSVKKTPKTSVRSLKDTNIPQKLLIITLVRMTAGQKDNPGTFAALHPRKQSFTEWPVLVLYAKMQTKSEKFNLSLTVLGVICNV